MATEDIGGISREPIAEDVGVDRSEIDGVNQIALVESRERGVLSKESGLDHGAEEEHRGSGAVVGAAGCVMANASAEF